MGGHRRDPVRPLAFGRGQWLPLLGCHVETSGLVAEGQGQLVPGDLLALVWWGLVMELGLMVVASVALTGVPSDLRGTAQAGQ